MAVADYRNNRARPCAEPPCNKPSGQRMQMEEAAFYTIRNGKIVREEFFYGGV